MSGWEWVIAISVVLVALAFLLLVIFLVMALVSLRKTINTTNEMCRDLEDKIHSFDPLFRALTDLGRVVEKRTEYFAEEAERACVEKERTWADAAITAAEFAMAGLSVFRKIKGRK